MATKKVYVVLYEYNSQDEQGTDIIKAYIERSDACIKANKLAESSIEDEILIYGEENVSYDMDDDRGVYEFSNVNGNQGKYKVVPLEIEL